MSTVTISTEEYNELRDFKTIVEREGVCIRYSSFVGYGTTGNRLAEILKRDSELMDKRDREQDEREANLNRMRDNLIPSQDTAIRNEVWIRKPLWKRVFTKP